MRAFSLVFAVLLAGCGASDGETGAGGAAASTSAAGATSGGAGGGGGDACAASDDGETLHLAVGATLAPGGEETMCLRWTAPEAIDISGFVGTLGPAGHHALLLAQETPSGPDGVAPCSEAELMDTQTYGDFQMLAGVSYESDGVSFDFPSVPVQVGLSVPKGTQLVLDAHFVHAGSGPASACATLDLRRGEPVIAKLAFRTLLPVEQYALAIPAHQSVDVAYEIPSGSRFRVAAASSHMHEGGTHFRLSVKETGETLYESTAWAEPVPAIYDTKKVVVEDGQTLLMECSFQNDGDAAQHFPAQMCVGGLYTLACSLPGAC